MENRIYLGNIDPNNNIGNTLDVRRQLMYYLLTWDSILMSDSQFLTDPRLMQLMGRFEGNYPDKRLHDVTEDQCDAEVLVQSGLIQVACRKTEQKIYTLSDVWTSMSNRVNSDVPYLPKTSEYAAYLDGLSPAKCSYELSNMANLFKQNLLRGVDDLHALVLDANNVQDGLIHEMLLGQTVLFADLLKQIRCFLQDRLITPARYEELYRYFYSCYSINIPMHTGSFTHTFAQDLPLHLDFGVGDYRETPTVFDYNKLRPTWGLRPEVLDLLSFADFIEVRKKLENHIKNGILIRHNTGILTADEWKDYVDVWADYTNVLEGAIHSALQAKHLTIDERLMEMGFTSSQKTTVSNGMELTINIIGLVPVVGPLISTVYNTVQLILGTKDTIVAVSNLSEEKSLQEKRKLLSTYTRKDTPIITKF